MKVLTVFFLALAVVLTSGCLTSEEPFYLKSDLKPDDRLVGTYQLENEQTHWSIQRDLDHTGCYVVTLRSDIKPCTMRFSGVLFQVGTNRFFDMLPILESCDHVAGSTPGPIEIMQGITLQPLHLVMRMDVTTNGLRYGVVDQQTLLATATKFPEYFRPLKDEQLPRMLPDTKKQREFLFSFGGDTNIFKPAELKRQAR